MKPQKPQFNFLSQNLHIYHEKDIFGRNSKNRCLTIRTGMNA